MCNTPKYAKLEERTGKSYPLIYTCCVHFSSLILLICFPGYGGGFNERENVEYIEREESDGEYDEVSRTFLSQFSLPCVGAADWFFSS